jgi:RNase P subunit RPR2
MTITAIPHARNQHTTIDYRSLPTADQDLFDLAQTRADNTLSATEYNAFMQVAAHAAGLDIAPDGEIARCACPTCHCALIFPTNLPGLRTVETTEYNLPRLQCPTCTDAHPAPHED